MNVLTDRPEAVAAGVPDLRRPGRFSFVATVVLALALGGLGGWVVNEVTTESTTTLPDGMSEVIENYLVAWEEHDEAALRSSVMDDFLLTEHVYELDNGTLSLAEHITDDADGVVRKGFLYDWQVEQTGEPTIAGDGPWVVSIAEDWILRFSRYDGMATYVIVDDGGTYRIADHYWAGLHYDT